MDENLFFKKATLLICSSLDVEVSLFRSFQFIRSVIPADTISLNIYEPNSGALRYLAIADEHGGTKVDHIIKLPDSMIHSIESDRRMRNYKIINRPEDDPMGVIIPDKLGLHGHSFIALRLYIEQQRLGVIDLFARGEGRYSEEHAQHLAKLREPFSIAMANALKHQELINLKENLLSDNRYLNSELLSQTGDEVVGADSGLADVMAKVRHITDLKNTVLILGETGTGKEVIANAIHRLSHRRNKPFIKVNCGAIPENLIDNELFGHEKGAYTGAVAQKRGRFERADGGTIFLDEIGELPPWAQIRLLRVLQTQEIERVGGSPPIKLDVRVIAATHRDLKRMVQEQKFREDLWFRINMFPISIPPLRRRAGDIPHLVNHFINKKSKEFGINPPPKITKDILEQAQKYNWPGNVRELENAVERSLILHRQGGLDFSFMQDSEETELATARFETGSEITPLNDVLRRHITKALKVADGKISGKDGASSLLDIHPNTLRNKMIRLGIPFGRKQT